MTKLSKSVLAILAAIALVPVAVAALPVDNGASEVYTNAPLTVNGGWQSFSFGGVGNTVSGSPFTYSAPVGTMIRIVDGFCYGDRFSVEVTPGTTTPVTPGATSLPGSSSCGGPSNGDAAFNDPLMSSGCWFVDAGSQSVTVKMLSSPYGSGGAFIRVDTMNFANHQAKAQCASHAGTDLPVPELGSVALVAAGVLGIGAFVVMRRK